MKDTTWVIILGSMLVIMFMLWIYQMSKFDDYIMDHYEKQEESVVDTPEEKAHAAARDKIIKEEPRKWDHIQKERDKIREKKAAQALADQAAIKDLGTPTINFEQPPEGTEIGGMKSFHVEKGEEKNTYEITTKREITFQYLIRAKNEEDAMIRTLGFVSKDGSGQREDVKRPMYSSKPFIREWIDKIRKVG